MSVFLLLFACTPSLQVRIGPQDSGHGQGHASSPPSVVTASQPATLGPVTIDAVNLPSVHVSVQRRPEWPLVQCCITAKSVAAELGDMEILMAVLSRQLQRGEPFSVLWDLRAIKVPSQEAIRYAIDRAAKPEIAAVLDELVCCVIIMISSPIVHAAAKWVLSICKPPNPVHIIRGPEELERIQEDLKVQARGKSSSGNSR